MRILIIDEHAKSQASRVVDYASRPENLYVPGPTAKTPGDMKEHTLYFGDYRVVFSLTKDVRTSKIFRHLSMSVPAKGALPHPVAVNEIIGLFGFRGGMDNCYIDISQEENCIIVAQLLES